MTKPIDQTTLLKLHKRMIKTAQVHRDPHPEEIANEYVVRLLQGLHEKATVEQAYYDIHRTQIGRKNGKGYNDRRALRMLAFTDKQQDYADKQPTPVGILTQDEMIDLENKINKIKCPRSRRMFNMLLLGYTQKEISEVFSLTESRVNQVIFNEIVYLRNI